MRAWLLVVVVVGLGVVACADVHTNQQVEFSHLSFELPEAWTATSGSGAEVGTWVPSENARHESIAVIRTNVPAGVTADAVSALLEDAQEGLTPSHPEATVVNAGDLQGVRVEFDYVPSGFHDTYHRVHAVFVDGSSFIHVLYTAKTTDPKLTVFSAVLRTLHDS